ncbi:hypothetical protein [Thermomonas sp. HDW16]|uniref:hypothetical protein n=1 Tax=Thermomonas sp. HDW16 TaxID=2714945 RepID=UPI00140B8972|nr:hypothetical protein [Thermomonas sp. HDW16]QIL20527.1 hypothetical protein G7079_07155 [Thermomonas sp. HDW16]
MLRDWSNVLGGGTDGQGGSGTTGIFPAKYNFDITAAPSCTNDFVVYTTNAAGASSSGLQETWTGTFNGNPSQGTDRTVTLGPAGVRQVVLTSSASDNTGTNFLTNGISNTARGNNLRNAINRWSSQTGFSAGGSGASVTITSNTTGNIANGSVSETLDSDFNLSGTDGSGTAGQPTAIAFNQLYQGAGGCVGSWNQNGAVKAPNVMWSYTTGNGYITETSPVLSYLDGGKQVAFVQRNGNTLQLVLLKPLAGSGSASAPATPVQSLSAAAYRACASNCYYAISFNGTSNTGSTPTYSSPFVDYSGDILWAGDGNGRLHKFTGVFQGNPQEVVAGGFPLTLEAGLKLSPPVSTGDKVFVGSQSGAGSAGGKLYRVDAATGTLEATSAKLARASTTGLRESPIVDLFTNQVYIFVFNDNTLTYTDTARCTLFSAEIDGCRAAIQFPTNFADASTGSRQQLGRGNGPERALYAGTFDDAFYNSPTGSGAMYIVGGRPDNTFYATLWKIPIVNGVMQSPVRGPEIGARDRYMADGTTDNVQNLSPVTLVKNGSNEYLYASIASYGDANGCGSGSYGSACLYMFNLSDLNGSASGTGAAWGTSNVSSAGLAVPGGTGGIVVDNVRPEQGASQIYFSHTGNTGNAVQASQSALD